MSVKLRKSIVLQMISATQYHLELNKTSLSLSNPSADSPKHRKRRGRMSDAEMITILITPIRFIRQISFASFSEHLQIYQYL